MNSVLRRGISSAGSKCSMTNGPKPTKIAPQGRCWTPLSTNHYPLSGPNPLEIMRIPITHYGSIICPRKVRNPMTLKNHDRRGVVRVSSFEFQVSSCPVVSAAQVSLRAIVHNLKLETRNLELAAIIVALLTERRRDWQTQRLALSAGAASTPCRV